MMTRALLKLRADGVQIDLDAVAALSTYIRAAVASDVSAGALARRPRLAAGTQISESLGVVSEAELVEQR
jgi:hypothetical protein